MSVNLFNSLYFRRLIVFLFSYSFNLSHLIIRYDAMTQKFRGEPLGMGRVSRGFQKVCNPKRKFIKRRL
jgi:hypothetical protein